MIAVSCFFHLPEAQVELPSVPANTFGGTSEHTDRGSRFASVLEQDSAAKGHQSEKFFGGWRLARVGRRTTTTRRDPFEDMVDMPTSEHTDQGSRFASVLAQDSAAKGHQSEKFGGGD